MSVNTDSQRVERLRRIIAQVIGAESFDADLDARLLDSGVASIHMLLIVGRIENEFDVEFDASHLTLHNFESLRSILSVIRTLQDE
jgi:acyl carrier protein